MQAPLEAPLLHLALVGTPNSGKTSLFNVLTGIYSADGGTFVFDGAPLVE